MPPERRKQVFTSPYFDNRVSRQGTIKGYSQKQQPDLDMSDPQQFARALRNTGMKMGQDGELAPTQDWGGLMGKASQQMNALSRGARPGEGSGLGMPMNSMYEQNPGFFNRGGNAGGAAGFGEMLGQTREQRIAQAQREGTFDTIRDKYNTESAASGMQMNKFGNMVKNAGTPKAATTLAAGNRPVDNALIEKRGFGSPVEGEPEMGSRLSDMMGDMGRRSGSTEPAMGQRAVTTPTPTGTTAGAQAPSQQAMNRAGLEEAVSAKKMLQEAQRPPMQIDRKTGGGVDTLIQGKYGKGFAANAPPGVKRPAGYEGDVNGRPFSEVMQGLANKPGIARKGDKFQPQQWNDALKRAKTK